MLVEAICNINVFRLWNAMAVLSSILFCFRRFQCKTVQYTKCIYFSLCYQIAFAAVSSV